MSDFLFDANVLIDIATTSPAWNAWSERQFVIASSLGRVCVNPIIYAECAPAFADEGDLDRWFDGSDIERLALPYSAAWRAADAFKGYRRAGGTRVSLLPDFYIGAHAEAESLTLVTRDAARYRTYFPKVQLITP